MQSAPKLESVLNLVTSVAADISNDDISVDGKDAVVDFIGEEVKLLTAGRSRYSPDLLIFSSLIQLVPANRCEMLRRYSYPIRPQ